MSFYYPENTCRNIPSCSAFGQIEVITGNCILIYLREENFSRSANIFCYPQLPAWLQHLPMWLFTTEQNTTTLWFNKYQHHE